MVLYRFLYPIKMINTGCSPSQKSSNSKLWCEWNTFYGDTELCSTSLCLSPSKDVGPFARGTSDPLVLLGICTSCSLSQTLIFSIYCLSSSDLEDLNPLDWVSMMPLFLFFSNPLFVHEEIQGNKSIIRNSNRSQLHTLRSLEFFCFGDFSPSRTYVYYPFPF